MKYLLLNLGENIITFLSASLYLSITIVPECRPCKIDKSKEVPGGFHGVLWVKNLLRAGVYGVG